MATSKKIALKLNYSEEKFKALNLFLSQKNLSLEDEITKFVDKLYDTKVPKDVKTFIENSENTEANSSEKTS